MIKRNHFFVLFLILILTAASNIAMCYKIGNGDLLKLVVVGMSEISNDYTVSPDGYISIPLAGNLFVSGKEIDEVKEIIVAKLSERLVKPEVYITLANPVNNVIYVNGLVTKSGALTVKDGMGISEILSLSGGYVIDPMQNKNDLIFEIKSLDGNTETIKYSDVMTSNYLARAGDVIRVDIYNSINVNVVGKVNTPGVKKISGNSNSVMSAIAMSGGFTPDANYGKVTIYDSDGTINTIDLSGFIDGINNSNDEPIVLSDNSTIVVPEIITGITVLGWVNNPGLYKIKPGEIVRLSDVISLAGGGVRRQARYTEIGLIRTENGNTTREVFNHNDFTKKGVIEQNPVVKPGDVVFVPNSSLDWLAVIAAMNSLINIGSNIHDFSK